MFSKSPLVGASAPMAAKRMPPTSFILGAVVKQAPTKEQSKQTSKAFQMELPQHVLAQERVGKYMFVITISEQFDPEIVQRTLSYHKVYKMAFHAFGLRKDKNGLTIGPTGRWQRHGSLPRQQGRAGEV